MKRLRDMEPTSALQRKAQQMISAVDPVPASAERMARIRRRLDEPRGRWGFVSTLRKLPALALAGLVVLFGASAFAAVRVFVEQRAEVDPPQAVEAAQQLERERAVSRAKRAQSAVQAAEVAQPEQVAPQVVAEQAPVQEPRENAREALEHDAPRVVPRQRNKAPARTPEQEQAEAVHDSELVHRAVKALRREGNPALAARLLEEDRIRNPNGPLAEEALSLRIEAAIALRDPRARTLAEQYVARYPSGRYLAIARRALSEGTQQ
jgi:hypothetical protein